MHPSTWLKADDTGLYCEPGEFYIDPMNEVATALVTHGHADHARAGHHSVYASAETLAIMKTRYGDEMATHQHAITLGKSVTFNDVAVIFDDSTHELTAEGNEEAIIYQNGQEVVIQGIDKEGVEADWLLQVVVAPDTGKIDKAIGSLDEDGDFIPKETEKDGVDDKEKDEFIEKIPVSDLDTRLPDFKLPTEVPDGYTLNPWAYILPKSSDSVVLSWAHPAQADIKYIWGEHALKVQQMLGTADLSESFTIVTFEKEEKTITWLVFQGEIEDTPFIIIATDNTLTEDQLRGMVP